MCLAADAKRVTLTIDSKLVASQFSGEYEAKEPSMVKYLEKLRSVSAQLEKFSINLVPREENTLADALSKLASSNIADLKRKVMMEVMNKRSTESEELRVMAITTTSEWYDSIQTYIQTGALPADLAEAKKTKRDAVWYIILWGRLYKKSFSLPFLRCQTAFESASDMVDIAANVERVVLLREAKNVGYKRRNENQSQGGAKKPNQGYQGNQRRNDVGNKGQGYRGNQNNRAQECAKCGRRGHIESECRVGSNTCFRCGSHDHYIRDCPKQNHL
ncbi:uncharacterized protein [Spinacia oleracea]|uniref:CCHC-type domain-containing protein n=1 Tax=Spinacia oleracea TaxID=3562 RepID=A0ABM3RSG1_SPIOL|nr:uncharacterized protein LOC130472139 [Spinacia oleracea]